MKTIKISLNNILWLLMGAIIMIQAFNYVGIPKDHPIYVGCLIVWGFFGPKIVEVETENKNE